MPARSVRVVVDANWYISACISLYSRHTLYYKILRNPRIQVFYSVELLAEYDEVIARPKFRKKVTIEQAARFKALALLFLAKTEIQFSPSLVRDSDDDYLLGICESCEADFLITGDQDLLVLESYLQTKILSMRQFVETVLPQLS